MSIEVGKTRLVCTVKVRESGGRSLEVTIPKEIVDSMDLGKNDDLIVLLDKNHSFFMYINPKKASIDVNNPDQGITLHSFLSVDDMEKALNEMKKKEKK